MHLQYEDRIKSAIQELVKSGELPGAVYGVATAKDIIALGAVGSRQLKPSILPMTDDTLFDLASLTKVVATTAIAMRLLERGAFRFDDLVSRFLPREFDDIRLTHLLTHTSGLPAWLDLTSTSETTSRIAQIAKASRLFAPGTRVLYSDLNYILLGYIVEKVAETPLDVLFIQEVAKPLGMHRTRYGPRNDGPIAATEWDADTDTFLSGVVHDENARSAGGISGHAGLFGTAQDLLIFGQSILRPPLGWLSPATIAAWLLPRTTGIPGELRAWGFQKPHPLSSAGDLMSDQAVGHTGFTGTSLWVDPAYNVAMVLLTNRVHLGRSLNAPVRLRPIYHNLVLSGLEH
ncbi:MAG: hypothetical protein C7B46_02670 [Sulfobacillus benefaciens]|uniref:Beta-lactamase-related domain-containing protein n=1 Tax=Sulfobacillus benefaciens TaxID=453960 RepID=A0A2T2XKQ3_9FIRM|nr:MAG: hypothetical protein C7B46_02670 [Sulfobacillus benefaciens]